ncbi:M91 family zinc metallopeptidase [Aquimarina algiphila]|uniref:M91 family zinc metallopeptidase n=1 Tax=Aquimarina algiphila TaxID=2047982 RepID=UPI00232B2E0B|nr:M91 family zinc metallopeptidase [Aquimarina algiphila]
MIRNPQQQCCGFLLQIQLEILLIFTTDDGQNKYRYENGQTQHQVDGEWTNIDENVTLSDYAISAIAQVDALSKSGDTGKGLVDYFSGDKHDVTITKSSANNEVGGIVNLNLDKKTQLPTTSGMLDSEFYVTLGHELAHRQDKNTRGETVASAIWYDNAKDSEIYATHIENKIRAESGIPLRTHYGVGVSYKNNKLSFYGDEKSRVIDLKGNSRYFDSSGNRITPSPGVAKDVYGGEIYKNRFNYNNKSASKTKQ